MSILSYEAGCDRSSSSMNAPTIDQKIVYLASSLATYDTPRYDDMISHTRKHFPNADILPAKELYQDNADWLATWPEHLQRISALVFFADVDGTVGKGVSQEVSGALAQGIPVHYLQDNGELLSFDQVTLELIDGGSSWRRFALVQVKPSLHAKHQTPKRTRRGSDDGEA